MKVCLIGQNLTNLILAHVFTEKKLAVDLYINNKNKSNMTDRTIAISSENFQYLKNLAKTSIPSWKTSEIKIYVENFKSNEIINFKNKNKSVFNLLSYTKLEQYYKKKIKNSNYVNIYKFSTSSVNFLNKIKSYDLVINTENKNIITRKYFNNKILKSYNSRAYTFIISHKKILNNTASQIFTKYGPLAFLPISNSKTSIVFSCSGRLRTDKEMIDLFKTYNLFYKETKINKVEKFDLKFSMLRNYTCGNILAFGDLIHRIHPLAGQGFNMTIRDIRKLSKIIDEKIKLGLPIDSSVAFEFQNSSKHLNYLYGRAIDGIYEFFKLDSSLKNSLSKPIFSLLNRNSIFKKYSYIFSEKGFNF